MKVHEHTQNRALTYQYRALESWQHSFQTGIERWHRSLSTVNLWWHHEFPLQKVKWLHFLIRLGAMNQIDFENKKRDKQEVG